MRKIKVLLSFMLLISCRELHGQNFFNVGATERIKVEYSKCMYMAQTFVGGEPILACRMAKVLEVGRNAYVKVGDNLPIQDVYIGPKVLDRGLKRHSLKTVFNDLFKGIAGEPEVLWKHYTPFRVLGARTIKGPMPWLIQGYYEGEIDSDSPDELFSEKIQGVLYVLPKMFWQDQRNKKGQYDLSQGPYRYILAPYNYSLSDALPDLNLKMDDQEYYVFAVDETGEEFVSFFAVALRAGRVMRTMSVVGSSTMVGSIAREGFETGSRYSGKVYTHFSEWVKLQGPEFDLKNEPYIPSFKNITSLSQDYEGSQETEDDLDKLNKALNGDVEYLGWLKHQAELCRNGRSAFSEEICIRILRKTQNRYLAQNNDNNSNSAIEEGENLQNTWKPSEDIVETVKFYKSKKVLEGNSYFQIDNTYLFKKDDHYLYFSPYIGLAVFNDREHFPLSKYKFDRFNFKDGNYWFFNSKNLEGFHRAMNGSSGLMENIEDNNLIDYNSLHECLNYQGFESLDYGKYYKVFFDDTSKELKWGVLVLQTEGEYITTVYRSSINHPFASGNNVEILQAYSEDIDYYGGFIQGTVLHLRSNEYSFKVLTTKNNYQNAVIPGSFFYGIDLLTKYQHKLQADKMVPKEDEVTGFIYGGRNSNEVIKNTKFFNGVEVEEIETYMRPNISGIQQSIETSSGFLGENESLNDLLLEDNTLVLDVMKTTHQHLVLPLKLIRYIVRDTRQFNFNVKINSKPYSIKVNPFHDWRGINPSPFFDDDIGSYDYLVTNLSNGESIFFSDLHVGFIEKYGFYEGREIKKLKIKDQNGEFYSYRVDPTHIPIVFPYFDTE